MAKACVCDAIRKALGNAVGSDGHIQLQSRALGGGFGVRESIPVEVLADRLAVTSTDGLRDQMLRGDADGARGLKRHVERWIREGKL